MKFGSMMALVCLVVGVNANAATLGTNGSPSELFLTVFNNAASGGKSIVIDLGIDAAAADFSTLTFDQNFSTQLVQAFGSISSNFLYSVVAASTDIFNEGIWTTHTSTTLANYDIVANSNTIAGNLANYAAGNPLNALGLGQSNASAPITGGAGYYAGSNFNGTLGATVPANMGGNVGTSLYFYSLLNQGFGTAANTLYDGKQWLLSVTGELTYGGAPIPIPPAIFMLGAALLGLCGIGRRGRADFARAA